GRNCAVVAERASALLNGKSRVSREAQARFREGLGVQLPGATRPSTDAQFRRFTWRLWLLIPGPARRGTLHDETGVKYDCSGMADEANSKHFKKLVRDKRYEVQRGLVRYVAQPAFVAGSVLCHAPSSTDWTRHGRHSLMKVILLFTALVAPLAAAATFDGGIQGRVLNAQGVPVAGATVTVTTKDEKPLAKVITTADGSYAISNLEPGAYTVTVSLANTPQVLRMDVVVVDSEPVPTRADFRVTAED